MSPTCASSASMAACAGHHERLVDRPAGAGARWAPGPRRPAGRSRWAAPWRRAARSGRRPPPRCRWSASAPAPPPGPRRWRRPGAGRPRPRAPAVGGRAGRVLRVRVGVRGVRRQVGVGGVLRQRVERVGRVGQVNRDPLGGVARRHHRQVQPDGRGAPQHHLARGVNAVREAQRRFRQLVGVERARVRRVRARQVGRHGGARKRTPPPPPRRPRPARYRGSRPGQTRWSWWLVVGG